MKDFLRLAALLLLAAGAGPALAATEPGLPGESQSHTKAYIAGGVGLALTGLSFWLAEEADNAYEDYVAGSDPVELQGDFDQAVQLDRFSAASLVAGQACLALAIYWRFLDKPDPAGLAPASRSRWSALVAPGRVAVQFRF